MNATPITADILSKTSVPFIQVRMPETLSGHKAHIYSTSNEQVEMVLGRILGDADIFGWGVKVGTHRFHEMSRGTGQHGKGVTVYFPKRTEWEADLAYLARLMDGYPFAGDIDGDDMVGPAVGHRYEFHADPGYDIDPADVHSWYVPAH